MKPKKQQAARPPGTEVDYWHVLPPEIKQWLQQHDDEAIHGYYSKKKTRIHPKELRRQMDHDRYARRIDAYAKATPIALKETSLGRLEPKFEEAIDNIGERAKLSNYFKKSKP